MLQLFDYKLPFRSPFKTGSEVYKYREGVLLHYRENDRSYFSEASPLPGFSSESLDEVRTTLLKEKPSIEKFLTGHITFKSIRDYADIDDLDLPSIQFALSFLSLSILANRNNGSIFELFNKKPNQKIFINEVIGHDSIPVMAKKIESSIKKGFKVIKLKAPYPLGDLPTLLRSYHKKENEIKFRLDANQSWPKSELEIIFDQLENLPIEYIEEPCRLDSLDDLASIQSRSSLPIALDESISSINLLENALRLYPDLTFVIKPMQLGNILEFHETISQYRSNFNKIVITTMLESKIGRLMSASAAIIAGDSELRHGLHTGHLLSSDLMRDFEVKGDAIQNLTEHLTIDSFSQLEPTFLKKLR